LITSLFSSDQIGDSFFRNTNEGMIINIRLTPGSHTNKITGIYRDHTGAYLAVSVTKPPVNEQANEELIVFMAKRLSISKSSVFLKKGHHGRLKQIQINATIDKKFLQDLIKS
jgi:uncharacterized protein (TIGR00251 family)